jgi:hypothetical protein
VTAEHVYGQQCSDWMDRNKRQGLRKMLNPFVLREGGKLRNEITHKAQGISMGTGFSTSGEPTTDK